MDERSTAGVDRPDVMVISGLPGTGKSTLADVVARSIRWLLDSLVTRQLMLGQSAVVDCLIKSEVVTDWTRNAARFDVRVLVVECVCSDPVLHRRRIEGRRREIPGWHEVGWDHVQRMREEFPPLGHKHLTIDAVDRLEDNVHTVLGGLVRRRIVPMEGG